MAAALARINSLQEAYDHEIAAATTPAAKERVTKETDDAINAAITKEGLSVDEYESVIELAQNDPDVRERILQRIVPPAK